MYSSRGSNGYDGQSYGGQSGYPQNLGSAYSGSSIGGPDSQHSLSSRHTSMFTNSHEADIAGYLSHPTSASHYGGQYGSVYGISGLPSAPQAPSVNVKMAGPSALEGRGAYSSSLPDSPKFSTSDYVSSLSHGFTHKGSQLYTEKVPEYLGIDRKHYSEREDAYMIRDMQRESTARYNDSVGLPNQHQADIYDRIDQSLMLSAKSLQSPSFDGGGARQSDYLAARGISVRHSTQDPTPYGGRVDLDPRNSSKISASSYEGQHATSILGAAPRRNVDELLYSQSSTNPGYGVSLPPGRDYAIGKGNHGSSLESDYHSTLFRGPRVDEQRDDRATYLREFERREEERRQELLHDRVKERERDKDRERERERERVREKERERGKKRDKERTLESRDKEKERERKREIEKRRERTPISLSDLKKDGRSLRRDSLSHEASHRRHSPAKEKRREYFCKGPSLTLVAAERDFLSIDKRYPKLFIAPEFTRAVVHWPMKNLKLSIHSPVSFEHDFVEDNSIVELTKQSSESLVVGPTKLICGSTVWNAKIILLSGLSKNALEDLSSEKSFDDRVPHICNILRFAVLKKDRSFMAIGGPWSAADGGDPAVDESSLIQTAIRYAKDVAQLDLRNCRHWNRFLEIQYDRVGQDGFFSHKEVTVIFVPDLSGCLPSVDSWRDQWLAHKTAIVERERKIHYYKQKIQERKEGLKDKKTDSPKNSKQVNESSKHNESSVSCEEAEINKAKEHNEMKTVATEAKVIKEDKGKTDSQTAGSAKTIKKIIRKIVKQKIVDKNPVGSNVGDNSVELETFSEQDKSSPKPAEVSTSVKKKVIKKAQRHSVSEETADKSMQPEIKSEKVESGDKPSDNSDPSSSAILKDARVKKTIKRKIIKRVPKKKMTCTAVVDTAAASGNCDLTEKNVLLAVLDTDKVEAPNANTGNPSGVKKSVKKVMCKKEIEAAGTKDDNVSAPSKDKKCDTKNDVKNVSETDVETEPGKKKRSVEVDLAGNKQKSTDEKDKKEAHGKDESRSRSSKESKDKRGPDEVPRHPGLILQTRGSSESKLRSLSLSLDSLLGYTDKDVEESTFELSLFAESLYEMLQYQQGCRILMFLENLRKKFVTRRNQRKRLREEKQEETDKKSASKRLKTNELPMKTEPLSSEMSNAVPIGDGKTAVQLCDEKTIAQPSNENTAGQVDKNSMATEGTSVEPTQGEMMDNETDIEEDPEEEPEEDPEEYVEVEGEDPGSNSNEDNVDQDLAIEGAEVEKVRVKVDDDAGKSPKDKTAMVVDETTPKLSSHSIDEKQARKESSSLKKTTVLDKELLQAFRFFDRNQAGFIRVEDLRLIIHSLGKFLSHRNVKELVQISLLESNTGRDDRILYTKLVGM